MRQSRVTADDPSDITWTELAWSMGFMIALGVGLLGLAAIAWAVWS